MTTTDSDYLVDFHVRKAGAFGRPEVMVLAPAAIPLDKLTALLQKTVTSNTDLRAKLGLKGCGPCASSGFHVHLWEKFDDVVRADLRKF
jgi:hypothetical protein